MKNYINKIAKTSGARGSKLLTTKNPWTLGENTYKTRGQSQYGRGVDTYTAGHIGGTVANVKPPMPKAKFVTAKNIR